jgi:hypothetical protein
MHEIECDLRDGFYLTLSIFLFAEDVKRVFSSVVVVAFQIAFRAEIHVNNVFSFFKNYY